MILHLFYKEWIKTRWAFLGALIIGICIVFYIFIMVEKPDDNARSQKLHIKCFV